MDKVSIVIPVYNKEKYIKECIDSVLNQTYKNIEIIAVYDKSNDRTLDILKQYSDQIIIIDKQSGNMTRALNDGIRSMTGEWFKYLGSDDILYPNAIDELVLEAKKLENKNFILYSHFDNINSQGEFLRTYFEPNYNNMDRFEFNAILLDHYIGNFTTSLIHKSLFEKYGMFNESYFLANDYELWLRFTILHGCRLHLVPKILAKYRQHIEGVGQKNIDAVKAEADEVRKIILSQTDPSLRMKYLQAIEKYRKNRHLRVKVNDTIIKLIFMLPSRTLRTKIIQLLTCRKEYKLGPKKIEKKK